MFIVWVLSCFIYRKQSKIFGTLFQIELPSDICNPFEKIYQWLARTEEDIRSRRMTEINIRFNEILRVILSSFV